MPISTVWILKYVQQCYVKWFWTISSLGAPDLAKTVLMYEQKPAKFDMVFVPVQKLSDVVWTALSNSTPEKFTKIWQIERHGITACIVIIKEKNHLFLQFCHGFTGPTLPAEVSFAAWLLTYNVRSLSRCSHLLMISWLVYPPSRGSEYKY